MRHPSIVGQVFGRLTVLRQAMDSPNKQRYWICRCGGCGREQRSSTCRLVRNGQLPCRCAPLGPVPTCACGCGALVTRVGRQDRRYIVGHARKFPTREIAKHHGALTRNYGITYEQYMTMLSDQNGVCKICGTSDPGKRRKVFCVDHDHKTNAIRALLCGRCNVMLAWMQDDPAIADRASQYLRTSGAM